MYGEIVTFENGLKGMVQDIRRNEIGCILFGSDTRISEGTKVTRTEREPEFRLETLIGRVVNALGEPIDGKGSIERTVIVRLSRKRPESLTENLSVFRWRRESFLLTLCFRSEEGKES